MNLDPDVLAVTAELRKREQIGFSEAINKLVRAGAARRAPSGTAAPFVQPTHDIGLTVDVSSVADALEVLDHAELDPPA